ncbi:MAG: ImmA/IrrE family metallo-endopeptidase [Propionibacterium sp.]|nr:ImmA/IrrE family metallo-endopeptidase [Propionibacterium sp.]
MSTALFNGQRFQALREFEGLTQAALARILGTSQPVISQIEKAERPLNERLMTQARAEFGLPESFFTVQPSYMDLGFPTFRKSSGAKVADERRIVRQYREAARVFEAASRGSGYHEVRLPPDIEGLGPEEAAVRLRQLAGLSEDGPITNMTRFLERFGFGVVTHLDFHGGVEAPKHSGISIPVRGSSRPLIALASVMPGAVMRFTLAHEMAHHIWDASAPQTWTSSRAPQELRAHSFAGALLLPASVIESRVTESLNLDAYLRIKADYGVSVGAVIMRAQRLERISPERARSLQIQLSGPPCTGSPGAAEPCRAPRCRPSSTTRWTSMSSSRRTTPKGATSTIWVKRRRTRHSRRRCLTTAGETWTSSR